MDRIQRSNGDRSFDKLFGAVQYHRTDFYQLPLDAIVLYTTEQCIEVSFRQLP